MAVVWAISKFLPHVYVSHLTTVTDHPAHCWLANLKDPCERPTG